MHEHIEVGDQPSIDWNAAVSRQLRHTTALIYEALGEVGPLDDHERRFIHHIAYNGGFLELASLLGKVRAAALTAEATAPSSTSEAAS